MHANPPPSSVAQVVLPCAQLAATTAFLCDRLGFRVDWVGPADAPAVIVVSGHGLVLRLEAAAQAAPLTLRLPLPLAALPAPGLRSLEGPGGLRVQWVDADPPLPLPALQPAFVLSRAGEGAGWGSGRAGMQYRDLLPGRLGGRFIASHIRIVEGGPVPDYVHFHRVRLQFIYCRRGWVRVVYEDQGPPFEMQPGDCVLQPPGIRHRVLEASAGLEVIELACPATHETCADHALALPNAVLRPRREFDGQRFVRHVAASAAWQPAGDGLAVRDSGIGAATSGLAAVRVLRATAAATADLPLPPAAELLFLYVLEGGVQLREGAHGVHALGADDAVALTPDWSGTLRARPGAQWLEVRLPAAA